MSSRIVARVVQKLCERELAGMEEHGADMDRTDMDLRAWLVELQSELMDGAIYLEKVLAELNHETRY